MAHDDDDDQALAAGLQASPDALLGIDDHDMEMRVRATVFGGVTQTRIGPFEVLERIGSGGMGEVFAALDPRLQRRVAIKVIRTRTTRALDQTKIEQRLHREARALAQLAHPNIVRVFDVGTHEGKLYMAMELIEGQTLRRWCEQETRSWPEVVKVFIAAGQALNAAHAAGLVHRDFKPENVMVETGGRVCVLDFGLAVAFREPSMDPLSTTEQDGAQAQTSAEHTCSLVGTPGYMAPEQYLREDPNPATDQFAFCVALYEALYGAAPLPRASFVQARDATVAGRIDMPPPNAVPSKIRLAVMRGLSVDPAKRWPDMAPLLRVLAAGQRKRSALLPALAMLAATATALIYAYTDTPPATFRCATPQETLQREWGQPRQQSLAQRFADATGYGETLWQQLHPALDAYARKLAEDLHKTCLRTSPNAQDADATLMCLQDRQRDFAAVLTVFDQGDAGVIARAHELTEGLPPLQTCDRPRPKGPAQQADPADLQRLAELRARLRSGKVSDTDAPSQALVAVARTPGHEGLLAGALLLRGQQQLHAGHPVRARELLEESYFCAVRTDSALAYEAATTLTLAFLKGGDNLDVGLTWARHARGTFDGPPPAQQAADILSAESRLLGALGRTQEGITAGLAALEVLTQAGEGQTRALAVAHQALAIVFSAAGRYSESEPHFREALRILTDCLGPRHPVTASATANLGTLLQKMARPAQAEALYRVALDIRSDQLREDHPSVVGGRINLSSEISAQGRPDAAVAVLRGLIKDVGDSEFSQHPNFGQALNNLGLLLLQRSDPREVAEGQVLLARARVIFERAYGASHPAVAGVSNNLGMLALSQGRLSDAHRLFTAALDSCRASLGPKHPEIANLLGNLARVAAAQERSKHALRLANESLQMRRELLSPEHLDLAASMLIRAQVLSQLSRWADAHAMLDQAQTIYAGRLDEDHPSRVAVSMLRSKLEPAH